MGRIASMRTGVLLIDGWDTAREGAGRGATPGGFSGPGWRRCIDRPRLRAPSAASACGGARWLIARWPRPPVHAHAVFTRGEEALEPVLSETNHSASAGGSTGKSAGLVEPTPKASVTRRPVPRVRGGPGGRGVRGCASAELTRVRWVPWRPVVPHGAPAWTPLTHSGRARVDREEKRGSAGGAGTPQGPRWVPRAAPPAYRGGRCKRASAAAE